MERAELEITAHLARLELSPEEFDRFESAVEQLLQYFSVMQEVDVSELPPTAQMALENRLRDDRVVPDGAADSILANAPELEDRFIVIPNVL